MTSPFDVLPYTTREEGRNVVMTRSMYHDLISQRNEAKLKYEDAIREYLNARAEIDALLAERDSLRAEVQLLLSKDVANVDAAADARAAWAQRKT